jgi:cytochrome c peroxidase
MVSCDTKYDHELPNNFAGFTPLENIGRELFFSNKAKCSQCHAGSNFKAPDNDPNSPYSLPTIKGTANIGLDIVYADNGKEDGQFKIPTLRNIALTAPYMHDGRFKTLEEVVEHYNSGVKAHTKLDDKLKTNGTPQHLNLNDVEKMALVAFLNTLTDQSMITDPKFANPFKQ